MGNLNVIDMDVSPGDYALILSQYSSKDVDCGLYSLRGLLNMYSTESINDANTGSHFKGASMCDIKASTEIPSRIFASKAKTRKGNEAVINEKG